MDSQWASNLAQIRTLLPARGTLLVGVSGGADSMALLYLLMEAVPNAARRIQVVHIHHGLRQVDADKDARLVKKTCQKFHLPFHFYQSQVSRIAKKQGVSLETAGRMIRQDCFLDAARRSKAKAVILAHHRDDQVETVLFHFIRGAGLRGLAGMSSVRPYPHPGAPKGLQLIRPLLQMDKAMLRTYLRAKKVVWREDQSNRDQAFTRNRIRKDLIPRLKRSYNPGLEEALSQNASQFRRDDDCLDAMMREALSRTGITLRNGCRVKRSALLAMPEALQWRSLAYIWEELGIPQKTYRHLDRVHKVLVNEPTVASLPGGWQVLRRRELLIFEKIEQPDIRPVRPLRLEIGAATNRNAFWRVKVNRCKVPKIVRLAVRTPEVVLDADRITGSLWLRTWEKNDKLRPLGMGGKTKAVRKIFSEMRLTPAEISTWPLLVHQDEILWIWQGPVAEAAKLHVGTRRALKIRICAEPGMETSED